MVANTETIQKRRSGKRQLDCTASDWQSNQPITSSPGLAPDVPISPRAADVLPVYNAGAHLQPAKNTVAVVPQNFPALVITPNADKHFRVQVGPFAGTQSAANARHDLEADGFKSIVKR